MTSDDNSSDKSKSKGREKIREALSRGFHSGGSIGDIGGGTGQSVTATGGGSGGRRGSGGGSRSGGSTQQTKQQQENVEKAQRDKATKKIGHITYHTISPEGEVSYYGVGGRKKYTFPSKSKISYTSVDKPGGLGTQESSVYVKEGGQVKRYDVKVFKDVYKREFIERVKKTLKKQESLRRKENVLSSVSDTRFGRAGVYSGDMYSSDDFSSPVVIGKEDLAVLFEVGDRIPTKSTRREKPTKEPFRLWGQEYTSKLRKIKDELEIENIREGFSLRRELLRFGLSAPKTLLGTFQFFQVAKDKPEFILEGLQGLGKRAIEGELQFPEIGRELRDNPSGVAGTILTEVALAYLGGEALKLVGKGNKFVNRKIFDYNTKKWYQSKTGADWNLNYISSNNKNIKVGKTEYSDITIKIEPDKGGFPVVEKTTGAVTREIQTQLYPKNYDVYTEFKPSAIDMSQLRDQLRAGKQTPLFNELTLQTFNPTEQGKNVLVSRQKLLYTEYPTTSIKDYYSNFKPKQPLSQRVAEIVDKQPIYSSTTAIEGLGPIGNEFKADFFEKWDSMRSSLKTSKPKITGNVALETFSESSRSFFPIPSFNLYQDKDYITKTYQEPEQREKQIIRPIPKLDENIKIRLRTQQVNKDIIIEEIDDIIKPKPKQDITPVQDITSVQDQDTEQRVIPVPFIDVPSEPAFDYFPPEPPPPKPPPPKQPFIKPHLDFGSTRFEDSSDFYDVYVKNKLRKIKKGKYRSAGYKKLNRKPMTKIHALSKGADYVDKQPPRSFKIKKAKKRPKIPETYPNKWSRLQYKFRLSKSNPNVIVEKAKYGIDSPGERRGITKKAHETIRMEKFREKMLGGMGFNPKGTKKSIKNPLF